MLNKKFLATFFLFSPSLSSTCDFPSYFFPFIFHSLVFFRCWCLYFFWIVVLHVLHNVPFGAFSQCLLSSWILNAISFVSFNTFLSLSLAPYNCFYVYGLASHFCVFIIISLIVPPPPPVVSFWFPFIRIVMLL